MSSLASCVGTDAYGNDVAFGAQMLRHRYEGGDPELPANGNLTRQMWVTRVATRYGNPDVRVVKTTVVPGTAFGQDVAGRDDTKRHVSAEARDMPSWAVRTIYLFFMVLDEEFKVPFLVGVHAGSACLLCCEQATWPKDLPGAVGVEVTSGCATVENSQHA